MKNETPPSLILKDGRASSLLLRKKGSNIGSRGRQDQVNLLAEGHNTRLLLCYEVKNNCDEGNAIRLGTIIAHSLYPRLFNKHQQKILKEALEKRKDTERLYVE